MAGQKPARASSPPQVIPFRSRRHEAPRLSHLKHGRPRRFVQDQGFRARRQGGQRSRRDRRLRLVFGGARQLQRSGDAWRVCRQPGGHKREGTYPLMLWQHNPDEPIGVWDDLADDGKGSMPRAAADRAERADRRQGLFAGQGRRAEAACRSAIARSTPSPPSTATPRKLIKLDIMEASIVSFPANRRAVIDAVKGESSA
jgi:hypothetical protein